MSHSITVPKGLFFSKMFRKATLLGPTNVAHKDFNNSLYILKKDIRKNGKWITNVGQFSQKSDHNNPLFSLQSKEVERIPFV